LWFVLGFGLVYLISDLSTPVRWSLPLVFAALALWVTFPVSNEFKWSPYYKIQFAAAHELYETGTGKWIRLEKPYGHSVTVNNDYHQIMLDLSKPVPGPTTTPGEHPMIQDWRRTYDAVHSVDSTLPDGPILIVGAGTGNDVAAALRNTGREIYAVEIDPAILTLGRTFHAEKPYHNPRVHSVVNDARSFLQNTELRFAHVIFGFLDSHTLLSSFSALRLDNFVYTADSLNRVRSVLLPGGRATISFGVSHEWIHRRLLGLMNQAFDGTTIFRTQPPGSYVSNGMIYANYREPLPANIPTKKVLDPAAPGIDLNLPTDDWPYFYLKAPAIPFHYQGFLAFVLVLCLIPIALMPRNRGGAAAYLPYFFLGAGFFLLETSNVVSLSLLYGSTWIVNLVVFSGILALILAGNWTQSRLNVLKMADKNNLFFILLFANLLAAYFTPTAWLLGIGNAPFKAALAITIFLGPVYFASLI
ncbi:MAG: class I SAM-dependent methyltransferase, partial [Bdellovibrionota bacterium]